MGPLTHSWPGPIAAHSNSAPFDRIRDGFGVLKSRCEGQIKPSIIRAINRLGAVTIKTMVQRGQEAQPAKRSAANTPSTGGRSKMLTPISRPQSEPRLHGVQVAGAQ
jgi:hypothetical protein